MKELREELAMAERARKAAERRGMDAATWRARIEERLDSLESNLQDVRARQTAIFTMVSAAAFGQILLRLLGH